MVWRSAIIAAYAAFAVLIGVVYGGRGLEALLFFYLFAAAWAMFFLVWGRAARAAGRWNVERLSTTPLDRVGTGVRPGGGDVEAAEAVVRAAPPTGTRQPRPAPAFSPSAR